MSDALLKNTFNKISPAYELVADVTVATATTQVDLSGLNFGKDDDLLLVSDVLNSSASNREIVLYFNGNYTNANYYAQYLQANSTTVNAERTAYPLISSHSTTKRVHTLSKIKLTNSGHIVTQSSSERDYDSTSIFIFDTHTTTTFIATSITSLRISGFNANQIGIGSRFQLYRLKAEKVCDITVRTATTQVNITGLNIDKNSEYIMMTDWINPNSATELYIYVNNNVTATNYYSQFLQVYGTSFQTARGNFALMSYNDGNQTNHCMTNIKLANSGYFVSQTKSNRNYKNPTDVRMYYSFSTSTFTASSITELNIKTNTTNGIGVNSRFTLYKLK